MKRKDPHETVCIGEKTGKNLVVHSSSTWTDSRMFSMKTKGLISQLRKFTVTITCLFDSSGRLYICGKVEVDLTITSHSGKESWIWTMGKRDFLPFGRTEM